MLPGATCFVVYTGGYDHVHNLHWLPMLLITQQIRSYFSSLSFEQRNQWTVESLLGVLGMAMMCRSESHLGRLGRLGMLLVYGPTARKSQIFCQNFKCCDTKCPQDVRNVLMVKHLQNVAMLIISVFKTTEWWWTQMILIFSQGCDLYVQCY